MAEVVGDAVSARLYRKISWRLIPFILLLYLICYVDRVNIGFAKLQFLSIRLNDAHQALRRDCSS